MTDRMDSSSDSDNDLFDFVQQYRKLEKRKKESKMNPQPVNHHPPVVNNSTISTEIIDLHSIISNNETESTKTIMNLRQRQSQIPNSEANTTISQITATKKNSGCPRSKNNNRRKGDSGTVVGPVICIGDFDDGYDFSSLKCSTVCNPKKNLEEDDYCYELLNRKINVGVYWRKTRIYRFSIRMFQSIESIYEYFANLENIDTSQVSLMLKKKSLFSTDTPDSINYKVSDFIDGEIEFYKSPFDISETSKIEEETEEKVTFHIKQRDTKHPVPISIKKTDRMCIVYIKLAEKLGLDVESFKLQFDGEIILKSDTIESLDLDGDECFELFEK